MADHQLASALILRRTSAEWTTLHEKKGALEIADQCEVKFEAPPEAPDVFAPEVAAQVKAKCGAIKGHLMLAIPGDRTLLRVVQLPTVEPEEIRGMVELQVDKFSPFPADQMAVSQEILDRQETTSRVLIAAVQRDYIDRLGQLLSQAGLYPRGIDVEVMGWWRLLKEKEDVPATGRAFLLFVEERSIDIVMAQDGVPVLIRSLGGREGGLNAAVADEIAEEIVYTLTALEAEWGAGHVGSLVLWRRDNLAPEFLERLRASCALEIAERRLEDLPMLSEGLARRALERGEHTLNLAPAEWRSELQNRKMKRAFITAASVIFGLWIAVMAGLLVGVQVRKSKLASVRAEVDRLAGPAKEVLQIQTQVRSLKRYGDRTYSGLECLREITARMPPGLEITSFTYKKYAQVNLRGEADAADPIYDFFKQLEESGLFRAVKPEAVTTQVRQGGARQQFKVTCELPEEKT
jgi:hypothetical protein